MNVILIPSMSYVVFAWLATFIYGFETIIIKLTGKYAIKNPWLFNILWNIGFVIFMIPIYATQHLEIPKVWSSLLITSVLSAVCSALFMISTFRIDVSVLSPLYNVKTGLVVLFAWLILGEKITMYQSFLVGIIIVMGFMVTIDEKFSLRSFFRKDIIIAMLFMLILAFYVIYLKKTIIDIGFWNATVWTAILTLVFLIPTYPKFVKDIKTLTKKQMIPVVLVSLTSVFAYILSNKAYEGSVGLTSVIMTFPASMILAFIMSIIWPTLMEKHALKIYALRFLAAGVMFICAIQLG